jgi:hypothetical protein
MRSSLKWGSDERFPRTTKGGGMGELSPLGPAGGTYNDWKGTVAAESIRTTPGAEALYELAQVDRNDWLIVGVDVGGIPRDTWATVYAVPTSLITKFDDWARVAAENGGVLPVVAFDIRHKDGAAAAKALATFRSWGARFLLCDALVAQGIDLAIAFDASPRMTGYDEDEFAAELDDDAQEMHKPDDDEPQS